MNGSSIEDSRYEAAQRRQTEIYDRIMNDQRTRSEEICGLDDSGLELILSEQPRRQQTWRDDHNDDNHADESVERSSIVLTSRGSTNTRQQDGCCSAAESVAAASDTIQGSLGARVMKRIQQEQIELFDRIKRQNKVSENIDNCGSLPQRTPLSASPSTSVGLGFTDIESEQRRRLEEIHKASSKESPSMEPSETTSPASNHRVKRKSLDLSRGFNLERSSSRQRLSIGESTSRSVFVSDYDSDYEEESKGNEEDHERSLHDDKIQDTQNVRKQLQRLNSFQNAVELIQSIPSQIDQKNRLFEMAEALRASYAKQMSTTLEKIE